jgi:hypothetical protein
MTLGEELSAGSDKEGPRTDGFDDLGKPQTAETLNTATPGAASGARSPQRRKTRQTFTGVRRAGVLLNEAYRLSIWRRDNGVVPDLEKWLFVLAHILAGAAESRVPTHGRSPLRHGLDWPNFENALAKAGLDGYSPEQAEAIFQRVTHWHKRHPHKAIRGSKIGELLVLSKFERHELRLRIITAVDESREERVERRKRMNRERERERMRAKRKGKHVPRSEYLARADRRRQFCAAHRISGRTLQRWIKKRDARVSSLLDDDKEENDRPTDFGQPCLAREITGVSGSNPP